MPVGAFMHCVNVASSARMNESHVQPETERPQNELETHLPELC